jgi:glycoside/pentoside/hexuronide:cation symporter, GPH family
MEIASSPAPAKEAFPTWRIVVYSLGSVGTWLLVTLTGLLTYFYVPPETSQAAFPSYLSSRTIFGLTFIGLIGYVGSLLNFFLGPLVSSWSDRSRARLGRRRAFMVVSFLPIAALSFLVFTPPVDGASSLNAAYLLGVVVLLTVFRSLYGVSGALVPELGVTSRIVMRFSTYGAIAWLIAYIIGSQAIFAIKDALMASGMSAVVAFRTTLAGLIGLATLLTGLQILVVDEKRYGSGKSSTVKLFPALKRALTNRTYVIFVLTQQVYFWGDGLFQIGLVYFVTILFGLSDSMMLVFGATMVGISLGLYPLVNLASRKVGKKALFSLALAVMVIVMLTFAFSDKIPIPKGILAWLIVAVAAIPNGITGIVPGAITTEIVREDCIRTGEPNEATFGAAGGLITAIPAGLPGLIAPSMLILGKSAANPAGVRLVAIVSAACMLLSFVMLRAFYDEKRLQASLERHGYK